MAYEITIEKVFAASHALRLPDGRMEPLHGHNWSVQVRVGAAKLDRMEAVMDFHELERAVEAVVGPWRNRHLNDLRPFAGEEAVNPSAERVAWWIGEQTAAALPPRVRLLSVHVGEAPGCTAAYRPSP